VIVDSLVGDHLGLDQRGHQGLERRVDALVVLALARHRHLQEPQRRGQVADRLVVAHAAVGNTAGRGSSQWWPGP
jgi:hypothetical protein